MKILVTGATGYFGNKLAQTLAEAGNTVHILARNVQSPNIPDHANIKVFAGDITDPVSIARAMGGCEQVYHAAALVKFYNRDRSETFKTNVNGTQNMLIEAKKAGIDKLVFTSTCSVYGPTLHGQTREDDPRVTSFSNNYEITKFMAEKLVREYSNKGLKTVIVNLSKVFGPGIETHAMSVNQVIKKFVSEKICIHPMPASIISNYVFIDDAVKGHMLAMQNGISGEKYIIGGENLSYTDFFSALRNITGINGKIISAPQFIAYIIGFLNLVKGNITGKEPFFTHKEVKMIYYNKSFSSDKAGRQLGYGITPFNDALRQTIYFINNRQ